MHSAGAIATIASMLLLCSTWSSLADAATTPRPSSLPATGSPSTSHKVEFRDDDPQALRLARMLLAEKIRQNQRGAAEGPRLRTAWVRISDARTPALFVLHGCSPTGNCGLYGFERSDGGWRLILNSLAQTCSVLASSHEKRRDLEATMHGSATQSRIKTYRWQKSRYVRVSVRDVTFDR